eukprot:212512_1
MGLQIVLLQILKKITCIEKEINTIKSWMLKQKINNIELEKFRIWLKNDVKLEQYFDILIDNGFDNLDAITTTNINQLKEIGIDKIGHRQQLMKHIQSLKL